jgi:endonuclease G
MKDWVKLEPYLRRISDVEKITEDHLWELSRHGGSTNVEGPNTSLTDEAIESWRRYRAGIILSQEDKHRLEAIVLPNGLRPAFNVQNDTFTDLPDPWKPLNNHRPFLQTCIRGIGRINVPGHATLQYAGTGFVVGKDLLLTNRHVADAFCQTGTSELEFTAGISPNVDLKQEVGNPASVTVNLDAPICVLSDWDAALLHTSGLSATVKPLRLAGTPPPNLADQVATIIGYPALDMRGGTEEVLQQIQIFNAVFGKKRLQPGRLIGFRPTLSFGKIVNALAHDCSTLGGNSGSALMDVEGEKIVGLHFGGDYLVANYSIPSWELAANQRLRDEGVLFD